MTKREQQARERRLTPQEQARHIVDGLRTEVANGINLARHLEELTDTERAYLLQLVQDARERRVVVQEQWNNENQFV